MITPAPARPLHVRSAATERTLDRYRARAFDWKSGNTCIHLARAQARNFGHTVPRMPPIRSALSARTALKATGFGSLEALLDSLFPRIAPAAMLIGDLAMTPGEDDDAAGFGAIYLFDGYHTLLGWHGTDPSGIRPVVRAMDQVTAAWRL